MQHLHTWTTVRRVADDQIVALYIKDDLPPFENTVPMKYLTDEYTIDIQQVDAKLSDWEGRIVPPETN